MDIFDVQDTLDDFEVEYVSGYRLQYSGKVVKGRCSPWCTDLATEYDSTINTLLDTYANHQIVRHSLFINSHDAEWIPVICPQYKARLLRLHKTLIGEDFTLSKHLTEAQAVTLCLAVIDCYFKRAGILDCHDPYIIDELRFFLEPYFVRGVEVDLHDYRLSEYLAFRVASKLAGWFSRKEKPVNNVFGF